MSGKKIREKDTRTAIPPTGPRPDPPGTRQIKRGSTVMKYRVTYTDDSYLQ